MKGKKGLDYIDWSISMGIFIIAITALFVFLKPGARPEHDQGALVSIVEQHFLERVQWFVHETPVYMKHFQDLYGSGAQALVEVNANGDIRFTAVEPATENRYEPIGRTGTRVTFNCRTSCDNTQFKLYGTTHRIQETIDMEVQCTPSNEPNTCTALLGATVSHQGLQQSEMNNLRTENYEALKSTWTYPPQREFAIYQDGNKIIGGTEPTQQANIFVKEWRMNLINDQGVQTSTTINIRVW